MLSALLDGELSETERAEVLEHLDSCEACRMYFAEISAIHDAMGDLEDVPVPDGFAAGVLARLHEETAPKRRKTVWRKWTALAACAAVVVLAVALSPNALRMGKSESLSMSGAAAPDMTAESFTTSLMAEASKSADAESADAAGIEDAVDVLETAEAEPAPGAEVPSTGMMMTVQNAAPASDGESGQRREADLLLYGEDAEFWLWNNCVWDEEQEGYWVDRATLSELPEGLTLGTPELVKRWNGCGLDFALVRAADTEAAR
jgi:anti-sigma factor RsiW